MALDLRAGRSVRSFADTEPFIIASLLSPAWCHKACAVSNFLKQHKCHFVTSAYKQGRVFILLANTALLIAGHGNMFGLKRKIKTATHLIDYNTCNALIP